MDETSPECGLRGIRGPMMALDFQTQREHVMKNPEQAPEQASDPFPVMYRRGSPLGQTCRVKERQRPSTRAAQRSTRDAGLLVHLVQGCPPG
ncbi:unnamed protein product [Arctogadus glacialis]